MALRKVDDILELVGGTPLVRIQRLLPRRDVELYAKLEFLNPGGSVKDRPALRMIEAAERSGELAPDKVVLEATSGNTGIGLAMVCAVKGYPMLFAMSESASEERRKILRAYGAEILLTPAHLSTDGAIEEAYRLAREEPDRYFLVDQFNNDDNWRSHHEGGTADEIWEATEGRVRAVVVSMGTTGTLMGITRRMREIDPSVRVIGVEPYKGHKIQGLKNMRESYPPGIYDKREPDEIVHVDDDSAYETARGLAREEGIFVGMSAGAAMRAALDQAEALEAGGVVVTILADGGERYLSTPLFVSEKTPAPLRFHNTLTRQLDDLVPLRPGHVGIYACGPSLDGPPDLGLCRRMVFGDLLRRYLSFRGFTVRMVVNLADIDDRTVGQCLAEGEPIDEFTRRWEQAFHEDMRSLGVRPADVYPRASEHVGDMIEQTRQLLDRGLAYEKLRSVYFDLTRAEDYGRLVRVDREEVRGGATVDFDYYEKDDPRDFTLFKRSTLAELKAGIYWQTPWGNARPGWHVECCTMAGKHAGQSFDLHLASTDLMFPHGENEIAIADGLGQPYARMWLHSEVVVSSGHKIGRALGNDVTLRGLLEEGHDPAAIRYWLLAQHYRRVLRFDPAEIERAGLRVRRLDEFVARLEFAAPGEAVNGADQRIYEARQGFVDAMDHDLNLSVALARLFAFVKWGNRQLGRGRLDRDQLAACLELIRSVDEVLGVLSPPAADLDVDARELVSRREAARAGGDFALADRLRDALEARGIQVVDTPAGTRWRTR